MQASDNPQVKVRDASAARQRWVALPRAAATLHISASSLISLIRGGRLIGRLVAGRFWWIRRDSLRRLTSRQGTRPGSPARDGQSHTAGNEPRQLTLGGPREVPR